jgi:hypothetical protein
MKDLVPSLPTDNLYKFAALFGLFLFAAFTYLRIHNDFAFRKEVVEFNTRAQINLEERTELEDFLTGLANGKVPADLKSIGYGKIMATKEELMVTIQTRLSVLNARSVDLKCRHETLLETEKHVETLCSSAARVSYLGIILMIIGFTAWYFKLQRYQDRAIRAQTLETSKKHRDDRLPVQKKHQNGQQSPGGDVQKAAPQE